jgi:hypothetical protein
MNLKYNKGLPCFLAPRKELKELISHNTHNLFIQSRNKRTSVDEGILSFLRPVCRPNTFKVFICQRPGLSQDFFKCKHSFGEIWRYRSANNSNHFLGVTFTPCKKRASGYFYILRNPQDSALFHQNINREINRIPIRKAFEFQ